MKVQENNSNLNESVSLIWEKLDFVLNRFHTCKQLFDNISRRNKSWAIVGGTLRVWVTKMENTTNDLDLVISANSDVVDDIISDLIDRNRSINPVITKLGGYRINTDEIQIDVWPADKTIGIVNNKFNDNNLYRSVSKSAALSLDSIVFTSKGTIYERGFFKTLNTGILNLNHTQVDQSKSIAYKAIRLCSEYELIPDFPLQSLILSETNLDYDDLLKEINAYKKCFARTGSRLVKEFDNINQPHKR